MVDEVLLSRIILVYPDFFSILLDLSGLDSLSANKSNHIFMLQVYDNGSLLEAANLEIFISFSPLQSS